MLEKILNLIEKLSFTPIISTELEFYLIGEKNHILQSINNIKQSLQKQDIEVEKISEETGNNQYEVSLAHIDNASIAVENCRKLKEIIILSSKNNGVEADFSAKPFANQPGSGLHVHISMINTDGKNIYQKMLDSKESDFLMWSIGGLCEFMLESMIFFAPSEQSYQRFTAELNKEIAKDIPMQKYNNAPVNVSWGGNNRTTAIRIPESTISPDNRHIEHRVAGSDADPEKVIAVILAAIYQGIKNKILPPEKIYGNAFDKQYKLKKFPFSLNEAKEFFDKGRIKLMFE